MSEKINQEILEFEETIFWGLTMRQFLFSVIAVAVAVLIYFGLKNALGTEMVSWVCMLAAFPFAAMGFFKYHGLRAAQFALLAIRPLATPRELVFVPVDIEEVLWDPKEGFDVEVNTLDQDLEDADIR